MSLVELWQPPGKNCGLCGSDNCQEFVRAVLRKFKDYEECPFYRKEDPENNKSELMEAIYSGCDILGNRYDFLLEPLPGEISARKIVLPFRADLVEKLGIKAGDYVLGRPMGAGCPIPHVLEVIEADTISGILVTWVVGPQIAREQGGKVKNVQAYHMIGFEGIASRIAQEPALGTRATFLPGFCMMNLNHTGLVNMLLEKSSGLQVRIEDIRILAGPKTSR
jgi:uncharacterized Fe-S cluster-containing protein